MGPAIVILGRAAACGRVGSPWWLIALLLAPALSALADDRPAKGMFLVAGPELQDPNFARSVVLLVDYGEHGAAGVIVNRRTEARLGDLLPETPGAEQVAGRVFLGGPVSPDGVLVLLRAEEAPEAARPVFDDVYVSSSREILERLVRDGGTFRIFAGYAGWAPGQLDFELRQGGWSVLPADVETVFDEEPEDVWRKMLRRARSPLASIPLPATPDDRLRNPSSIGCQAHGTGAQQARLALPSPGGGRGGLGEGRPGAEARGGEGSRQAEVSREAIYPGWDGISEEEPCGPA